MTGATGAEVARLQEQIGRLEVQLDAVTKCVVCQDQDKGVILNCGHLCACRPCAERIRDCPLCRVRITERRDAYR